MCSFLFVSIIFRKKGIYYSWQKLSKVKTLWKGHDRREPSRDDTNDNNLVSRKGRDHGTGHSKNRSNAYRQPKEIGWYFNDDGSYDVTYSDGTVEKRYSFEDIDVPEADTLETLQAELEKATSERDAIMAEAEIPRNP
ncbi:MAG: hypothetical protein J6B55_00185 [Clostridia bacterium]|nr:hypothetical protein [Clostridia bacterium]